MKVSFLLFLLFSLSFCYGYSNDPQLCNYRGIMTSSGTCACNIGYYGQNCTISPANDDPQVWEALHSILIIEYFGLMVIVTLGLIYNSNKNLPKTLFFIGMTIYAYSQFIRTFDQYSFYNIYPYGFSLFLVSLSDYLEFACYLLVLVYWIEIYHFSVKLLRDVELLKKVNSLFKKEVTVEEVSNRANRLTKLRIPLIVIIVIQVILDTLELIFECLYLSSSSGPITYVTVIYNAICKLGICIGFLIYGRKLIKIMPHQYFARINYISKLAFVSSAILLINWVLAIVIFSIVVTDPLSYSISIFITTTISVVNDACMIGVFFKRSDKFPYFFNREDDKVFSSSTDKETSEKDPQNTGKNDDTSIEMQAENEDSKEEEDQDEEKN